MIDAERMRNRFYPGCEATKTSTTGLPAWMQPLYVVACANSTEEMLARSVKPAHVRARFVRVTNPNPERDVQLAFLHYDLRQLFENPDDWLQASIAGLGGQVPLDLLSHPEGLAFLQGVIKGIKHGFFS